MPYLGKEEKTEFKIEQEKTLFNDLRQGIENKTQQGGLNTRWFMSHYDFRLGCDPPSATWWFKNTRWFICKKSPGKLYRVSQNECESLEESPNVQCFLYPYSFLCYGSTSVLANREKKNFWKISKNNQSMTRLLHRLIRAWRRHRINFTK